MICGEFSRIYATTNQINPSIGEIDMLNMNFDTDKGVQGTLKINFSANGFNSFRLVLFGTRGSLVITHDRIEELANGKKPKSHIKTDDGGYKGEYLDFHKAITTGETPEVTFSEGYRDFVSMLTALKSGESGKVLTPKF